MLLKDFYKIQGKHILEDKHIFEIVLNPEHQIYKGHFPDFPIMPGVCSVQIVKECVSLVIGENIEHRDIKICKFVSSVNPFKTANLILELKLSDLEDNFVLINATLSADNNTVLKFKSHSIIL